jgi:Flp pilus assembly protein TadB
MLSHEDERRLAAIERQMLADDPEFVQRFRQSTTSSMSARPAPDAVVTGVRRALCALAVLAALVVVLGMVAISPALVLVGAPLVAAAVWSLRWVRRSNDG